MATDDLQRAGDIFDAVRQRPDLIERAGKRHHAIARHAAIGWLQTNDTTQRCGLANGSSGIAAHGERHQVGSDRGGCAP